MFALEETVQGFLLVTTLSHSETANEDLSLRVLLNTHAGASLLARARLGQHVKHELVVDLDKADFDRDLIVETAADLGKDLVDCARDESPVLVIGGATAHGERFTGASLTVAHDGAVEAVNDLVDSLLSAVLEDVFLGRVVQEFIKFECPLLLLIVDDA